MQSKVRKVSSEIGSRAHIVRKTCAHHRTIEFLHIRYSDSSLVECRTLSPFGSKHLVAHRIVDDTNLQSTRMFHPYRNTKAGVAMCVVRGPIQWIDDPLPFASR